MKKALFLGVPCISVSIPREVINEKNMYIIEYTGVNADIGAIHSSGTLEVLTEKEYALKALKQGKGVLHQKKIYFLKTNSPYFMALKKKMAEFYKKLDELEQFLYVSLFDPSYFYLVKGMLDLYKNQILSDKDLKIKLRNYLKEDDINFLFQFLSNKKVA